MVTCGVCGRFERESSSQSGDADSGLSPYDLDVTDDAEVSVAESFPPIADYGFLSDCENNCLVAPDGSVEWLCLPRPDSPSVFGAILDRSAGSFRFGPSNTQVPHQRRYVPGTMVLETTWHTPTGWLLVHDFLVVQPTADEARRPEYRRGGGGGGGDRGEDGARQGAPSTGGRPATSRRPARSCARRPALLAGWKSWSTAFPSSTTGPRQGTGPTRETGITKSLSPHGRVKAALRCPAVSGSVWWAHGVMAVPPWRKVSRPLSPSRGTVQPRRPTKKRPPPSTAPSPTGGTGSGPVSSRTIRGGTTSSGVR